MISLAVDAILESVLAEESGEYTNDPNDSGGPTRWGVTLAMLSVHLGRPATAAEVQALERDTAKAVFETYFVRVPHFDQVLILSASIGERLVDGGVLCGPSYLAKYLQRALNVFNLGGTRYPDIADDGDVGAGTLNALRSYLSWRGSPGEAVMVVVIECLLGAHFVNDAEARPKDEKYVFGWFQQRVRIPSYVGGMQTLHT